jgi:hypothetical protein
MSKLPDGFIKWDGKTTEPPVSGRVEIIRKDGKIGMTYSDQVFWANNNFFISDIVAYRPLEPQYDTKDVAFKKEDQPMKTEKPLNRYQRQLKKAYYSDVDLSACTIVIDVYDVLKAFNATNPATQHAIKKLLASGQRGYKDTQQDLDEAIQSIQRAKELEE